MLASCYVDVPAFQYGAPGVETGSLLGGSSVLNGAVTAGATSLTVASATGFVAGPGWLLDGPNSEPITIVSVAGNTLNLTAGTQAAHAAGICAASPGAAGSLADVLVRAAAWAESFCGQGRPGSASDPLLFALARTERHRLPGPHAAIDPAGTLSVRPLHFPLQAVAALTLDWGQGVTWGLDQTQIEPAADGRSFDLPPPAPVLTASGGPVWPRGDLALLRAGPLWLELTYTAGIPAGAVPWDLALGVTLVACHYLSLRENPTGAAERHLGKKAVMSRQRGEGEGASALLTDARRLLMPYRNQPV